MEKYTDYNIREYAKKASQEVFFVKYGRNKYENSYFTRKDTAEQAEKLELIISSALIAISCISKIYNYNKFYQDIIVNDIEDTILITNESIIHEGFEINTDGGYGSDIGIDVQKSILDPIDMFFEKEIISYDD